MVAGPMDPTMYEVSLVLACKSPQNMEYSLRRSQRQGILKVLLQQCFLAQPKFSATALFLREMPSKLVKIFPTLLSPAGGGDIQEPELWMPEKLVNTFNPICVSL